MRKVFDVYIDEQLKGVYNIPEREHGGYNGEPKTWWVWTGAKGKIPTPDSDSFVPYSNSIRRPAWTYKIQQKNYTKHKWGETDFRSSIWVEMFADGKLIYAFGTFDVDFALAKIGYLKVALMEHPYDFRNPETQKGRKIWWKGLPATIQPKSYTWEVTVHPDLTNFSAKQWWEALGYKNAKLITPEKSAPPDEMDLDPDDPEAPHNYQGYINWGDAFDDKYIDWFRK